MNEIKLLFTDEEMIAFLHKFSETSFDEYKIVKETRTFEKVENCREIEYEREVDVIYLNDEELKCSDEMNYSSKHQILVNTFIKRFRAHLLNC